jgi:hypothetical protein
MPTISLTVDAIKSTESHVGLIKEMSTKGTKSTKKMDGLVDTEIYQNVGFLLLHVKPQTLSYLKAAVKQCAIEPFVFFHIFSCFSWTTASPVLAVKIFCNA